MNDLKHDERKLPKWAQERLERLRDQLNDVHHETVKLRAAHAILTDREWFTILGPFTPGGPDLYQLWFLDHDNPHPACSLGRGDLLMVGRAKKTEAPNV